MMKRVFNALRRLRTSHNLVTCFIVVISAYGCERFTHSNRSLVYLYHPLTNEVLSLLVLSGVSEDYTYVVQGMWKSLDIPGKVGYVSFKDSFGLSYDDSTWVIYYLGDIIDSHEISTLNWRLLHISKSEYRALLEKGQEKFLYRYVF